MEAYCYKLDLNHFRSIQKKIGIIEYFSVLSLSYN